MSSISIYIAEDQGMLLGALSALLAMEEDINVVGKASNGKLAWEGIQEIMPDIVLTDIEMPEMTGIELAEAIADSDLDCKVMILTTFARSGYLSRALDAGVRGYMLKDAPSEELAASIRKVQKGRKVIDPELMLSAWDNKDPLSDKERNVLRLAESGLKTEEIAQKLFLSSGTVRNYLSNAASKLNANNRIEAARIARQKGWL